MEEQKPLTNAEKEERYEKQRKFNVMFLQIVQAIFYLLAIGGLIKYLLGQ